MGGFDDNDDDEGLVLSLGIQSLAVALSQEGSPKSDPYMMMEPSSPACQKSTGFPLATPSSATCWQSQRCINGCTRMLHGSQSYG